MKVLLVGGGGREHALGWKIAQSPLLTRLFVAPGNPGLKPLGELLAIGADDVEGLVSAARANSIDLVVIGPEAPLALGLGDRLRAAGVPCFGPGRAAARLESSKAFMKDVATRAGAPTAAFGRFREASAGKAFLDRMAAPYVIKADGLAAGKGVIIAATRREANAAIDDMLSGRFGHAGAGIVIEEFMSGEEASCFVLTDGESVLPLAAAQDHKRAFDGDKGPNTGGMGACSPAPVFTPRVEEETLARIVRPVLQQMREDGAPYTGVLFAGLMIGERGPRLVEFNARFGDPECQALMRRLTSDILPALHAAATGRLADISLDWSRDASAVVVMAADGYPGDYKKGSEIRGVARANALPGVVVFQAGTEERDGALIASGGRALSVSATGPTLAEAVARAYAGVDAIDWPQGFCRRDIGWRALRGVR
ncbi:MAG: phosphoribosylamine--glycine ligase [Parvularculaceae bacterium]